MSDLIDFFQLEATFNSSTDREAVQPYKKTLQARKRELGDEHPGTLHTMHSLAHVYSKLDQHQEGSFINKH